MLSNALRSHLLRYALHDFRSLTAIRQNATVLSVLVNDLKKTSSSPVSRAALYSSDASSSQLKVDISDSCVKKLRELQQSDPDSFLRVSIESGGCSGFQYKFELDDKLNSDDKVFSRDGVKVVVDCDSLPLIDGSTIDYYNELIRSAFRIADNPQSEKGCSCGSSFAAKL